MRIPSAALSLLLAACALSTQPDAGESPGEPVETPEGSRGATLTLEVSPEEGRVGRPVAFTLRLVAGEPMTLEYADGQRYDFEVRDSSGEVVWRWSDDKVFTMAIGREQLREGGELVYRESWSPQSPGDYEVTGIITASSHDLVTRASFTVS